jgi:hypothetical protein
MSRSAGRLASGMDRETRATPRRIVSVLTTPARSHRRAARSVVLALGFAALLLTGLSAGFSGLGGRGANDLGAVFFILAGLLWVAWALLVLFLLARAVWRWLRSMLRRYGPRRL